MRLFRRRQSDPATEQVRVAFARAATHVAEAQRSLLSAIPTPRDDGRPLAEAIDGALEALDRCVLEMPRWRDERVLQAWEACSEGIRRAADEARALATEGPMDFERLNARVGDVLHPLEEFVDAERALRTL